MPKKSIFAQLRACAVPPHNLLPSPRYQNPGLLWYRGKHWLSYRYHRGETKDNRSGLAICEINATTGIPVGQSQRIELANPTNSEHHEDSRLFLFRGEPHISYTEMTGYRPGVDYTCVMKYARLKLTGQNWSVVQEWQPVLGKNSGFAKEKNWVFFDHDGDLHCVYSLAPEHVVVRLDGAKVVKEFRTKSPEWGWGHLRGGTPPVDLGDGRMLSIFHSSISTETPPHYVRYYAGAYTMEARPPFKVLQISEIPIMAGSEEDGHRVDPRYVQGWKPYVVFPCGLTLNHGELFVSFGINDWQCAVGRLTLPDLKLGAPDGSSFAARYFRTDNGTRPVKYVDAGQRPIFVHWKLGRPGRGCSAPEGYIASSCAREAVEISETEGVFEITRDEYEAAGRRVALV